MTRYTGIISTDGPVVPIQAIRWLPIGGADGSQPTHLLGTLQIGPLEMHVDAIQLVSGDEPLFGTQEAADADDQALLDALSETLPNDGPFQTVELYGRHYVLVATPYCT